MSRQHLIAGAGIALALGMTAPAQAEPFLSVHEARAKIRHLIVHKNPPAGGVDQSSIVIDGCVRRAAARIRCHVEFTDNDGIDWSGNAWSKVKPSDPSTVYSNYDVWG